MATDGYTVPAGPAEAELREKGSRFVAVLVPVEDEEAAQRELAAIRARSDDATHHCWAWRLGPEARERSSDDGEPSGTAGEPILRVLRGAELTGVLSVVVRWYGGTKLGKGGLARAYGGAVREALADLRTVRRRVRTHLRVRLPYPALGALQRLVHPPEVEILEESYGERVELVLAATIDRIPALHDLAGEWGLDLDVL